MGLKLMGSYSSRDREKFEALRAFLVDNGHVVWYDQFLLIGQAWWDEILANIETCDGIVIALSERSIESYPCQLEREYAKALGKRVFFIQIDEIDYSMLDAKLGKDVESQIASYPRDAQKILTGLSNASNTLKTTPWQAPVPLPKKPKAPVTPLANIGERLKQEHLDQEAVWNLVNEVESWLYQSGNTSANRERAVALLERIREHRSFNYVNSATKIDKLIKDFPVINTDVLMGAVPANAGATLATNTALETRLRISRTVAIVLLTIIATFVALLALAPRGDDGTPTPVVVLGGESTPIAASGIVATSTSTPTDVPTSTSTPTDVPTNTSTPTDVPTSTSTPTDVPTNTSTPTDVPTSTSTHTATPTEAPPPDLLIYWTDEHVYVTNISGYDIPIVAIQALSFRATGESVQFRGTNWDFRGFGVLANKRCAAIYVSGDPAPSLGRNSTPRGADCGSTGIARRTVLRDPFWRKPAFEVLSGGDVLQTCTTSPCYVVLPTSRN